MMFDFSDVPADRRMSNVLSKWLQPEAIIYIMIGPPEQGRPCLANEVADNIPPLTLEEALEPPKSFGSPAR